MKISYDEFKKGDIKLDKVLDKAIIKSLKHYALQVRDIVPLVDESLKNTHYQTPISQRISVRLRELKKQNKVEYKKIKKKHYWGLVHK